MIPSQTIYSLLFTIIVSITIPLFLMFYSRKKLNSTYLSFFTGALVYLFFQLILRMSIIYFLNTKLGWTWIESSFLFLAVTASLFEVGGKYLGYNILMKKKLHLKDGLMFGVGFIAMEMILISAFTAINYFSMSLAHNGVAFSGMLERLTPSEVEAYKIYLLDTPSFEFLAMGLERIITLPIQLSISLMIVYSVISKSKLWLLASLLIHFSATFLSLWAGSQGVIWNLIVLLPFCAAGIYIIYYYFSRIYPKSERIKQS